MGRQQHEKQPHQFKERPMTYRTSKLPTECLPRTRPDEVGSVDRGSSLPTTTVPPTILAVSDSARAAEPGLVFGALEAGAPCLDTLEIGGAAQAQVLVQAANESPTEFARRVTRSIAGLSVRRTRAQGIAVLSVAPGADSEQTAARCSIALALLRRFANVNIVLARGDDASSDERMELMALADSLVTGSPGRSVVARFCASQPEVERRLAGLLRESIHERRKAWNQT
jgi:hypothetical protein